MILIPRKFENFRGLAALTENLLCCGEESYGAAFRRLAAARGSAMARAGLRGHEYGSHLDGLGVPRGISATRTAADACRPSHAHIPVVGPAERSIFSMARHPSTAAPAWKSQTELSPGPEAFAYCNTSFAQLGSITVSARYSGDASTSSSTGSLGITVGKVAPTGYIASNPVVPPATSLPYGQAVILGATFTPAAGVAAPTGTVTFYDGAAALATEPINADGHAGLVVAAFSVGPHGIRASYTGDANYLASVTTLPVPRSPYSVIPAPILLTPAWSVFEPGQPITLYATPTVVSPGNATPAGTVTFSAAGNPIAGCAALPLVNGMAQCAATLPSAGTFNVSYSGDTDTAAVPSVSYQPAIGKALPGIYASASGSAVLGAPVTVNAQVAGVPGLAAPTGTVTFTDNGVTLAVLPLGGDGRVSLVAPSGSLAAFALGAHDIKAAYNGDAIYQSTAVNSPIVVSAVSTMVTVSATAAQAGSPVTLAAVVTVVSPGSATLTGTVDSTEATPSPVARACR